MSLRVCIVSFESFRRQAFRAAFSEAQDVLAECCDVDVISLAAGPGFEKREFWQRRLAVKDFSGTVACMNPGLQSVRLKKEYDLFIFFCPVWLDIAFVNAIQNWRDQCKRSVCWIVELWAGRIHEQRHLLSSLRRFEHVFIGLSGSLEPLGRVVERPTHFLPPAVDTLRFSPYPNPPERVVDCYSIGRRLPGPHSALLRLSSERNLLYVHDTLQSADSRAADFREHRNLYGSIAKRSKFFVVAPAKADLSAHTSGQIEVAGRYFEGAAAGAVMIGQVPQCEAYKQLFPWPEAVVEFRPDGSDVEEVLSGLLNEPERVTTIGQRNAREALLRHDWIHRWNEVFRVAGLPPTAAMLAREKKLQGLAALAAPEPQALSGMASSQNE